MRPSLIDAYCARLGVHHPGAPDLDTLRRLHAAHAAAIPFENLDILFGRNIHLDLDSLRAKLVDARRGGYCFEHNTLFLAMLRELGFEATAMEARVLAGATTVRARTHMVLIVRVNREEWLADVGFGGEGPLEPVPMRGGAATPETASLACRVVTRGSDRVLQMFDGAAWADQYAFLPQPIEPIDVEVANWYTSTHPQSVFRRTLTAQRATHDVRYVLRYPTYTEVRGDLRTSRDILRTELVPLLREVFLIDLSDDTRFPLIDDVPR